MLPLDMSSLQNATRQLAQGLAQAQASPCDTLLRDGVIQRFEYTYELCWKMLKRHLEATSAHPQEVDSLSFQELIRQGNEKGLLLTDWETWRGYRAARGATSHVYDAQKAGEVYAFVPGFLEEARFLLARLEAAQGGA